MGPVHLERFRGPACFQALAIRCALCRSLLSPQGLIREKGGSGFPGHRPEAGVRLEIARPGPVVVVRCTGR